jgi:DNA-binding beta-propeller fold protein YncE
MRLLHLSLGRALPALLAVALVYDGAHAGQGFANVQQTIFVAARDSQTLTVIDTDSERVIGKLELGLAPEVFTVSGAVAKLAAIDGKSRRIVLAELVSGEIGSIYLSFVPAKLALAPDGLQLAAAGDGEIVFLDLLFAKETARAAGLPPVRDAVFSGDSQRLLVSFTGREGVAVFDAHTGRETGQIAWKRSVSSIVRSANGREGFAKAEPGNEIAHLDLINERVIAEAAVSANTKIVPTGLGKWLLALDGAEGKIRVEQPSPQKAVAAFDVGPGVSGLYSAWFDTVAIASAFRKAVVYDLDAMKKAREIPLEATAGPGSVTPDGKKLFLPLEEAGKVAVIDAQARRLTNMIPVGPEPVAAVMAGGYGACH